MSLPPALLFIVKKYSIPNSAMIIFKASWAKVYFFKRMTFIMLIVSRWLSLCFTKMLDLSCGYFYSLRLRKRHFTSPTFVAFCCVTLDLLCVILHRWHRQLRKWRCNTRQRSYSFYFYFYFYFYNGFLSLFVFVGLFWNTSWVLDGFFLNFFEFCWFDDTNASDDGFNF